MIDQAQLTEADSARRPRARLLLVALGALVWVVCLPRMVPSLRLDRGIFVSVGERLLAGDALYSGVWDNKDPLFYYVVAVSRSVSPIGDVAVEVVWVATACSAVALLVRSIGGSRSAAFVGGFVLAPLVLTGGLYLAGHSHLPGVAVGALALAMTARRRYGLVGVLLGVLLFLKLVVLPVAALAVMVWIVTRRDFHRLPLIAMACTGSVGSVVGLLTVRGELGPYVRTQVQNVSYSQSDLLDPRLPFPVAHLARIMTSDALVVTASVLVVLAITARWVLHSRDVSLKAMWLSASTTFVGSYLVLAVTGLWQQHNQILLLPALIGVVLLSRWAMTFAANRSRFGELALAGALIAAAALLGGPEPVGYIRSFLNAPDALAELNATPPETRALLRSGPPTTYARVGQNDDLGHAFGLRQWSLVCAHFHQYPFDPSRQLRQDAKCLSRADVILISASARPLPEQTTWNGYLDQVTAHVADGYTCVHDHGVEVCRRHG